MEALIAIRTRYSGDLSLRQLHKSWDAVMCTSSFWGDFGNLEQAIERGRGNCLLIFSDSGEDPSQHLDKCSIRNLTHRQQLLKYVIDMFLGRN